MKATTMWKLLLHVQVTIVSVLCFQSTLPSTTDAFAVTNIIQDSPPPSSPVTSSRFTSSHNNHHHPSARVTGSIGTFLTRRRNPSNTPTLLRLSSNSNDDDDGDDLSQPEQNVYDILQDLHDSDLPFRLVVVGNGAILESTSLLGPTFKLGNSPRTGEPIVTFASDDQSFEFHVMISQVSKIVLTEKTKPDGSPMQIFRFLTAEGKPMSSLIVADKSTKAQEWFASMVAKHGNDIQL